MQFSEIELPSNKKFGFFFTFIFIIVSGYFLLSSFFLWAYIFILLSIILLTVTLLKAKLLLPLNKVWMKFGLLLGVIISPIVMGIIFFGIFTPIAFMTRFSGRDELLLKFKRKKTYWIVRDEAVNHSSFKQQF